jgi:hypothetical protein
MRTCSWTRSNYCSLVASFALAIGSACARDNSQVDYALIVAWSAELDASIPCLILTSEESANDVVELAAEDFGCRGRHGVVVVYASSEAVDGLFSRVPISPSADADKYPWVIAKFSATAIETTRMSLDSARDLFLSAAAKFPQAHDEIVERLVQRFPPKEVRSNSERNAELQLCGHVQGDPKLAERCAQSAAGQTP